MRDTVGIVFDIEEFAVFDGPGIRVAVFLKGCPLRCQWCQNPEGLFPYREMAYYGQFCIGCGECRQACPEDAITYEGAERIIRARCTRCGACAEVCPAVAIRVSDRLDGDKPTRTIRQRWDKCVFCGQCELHCTTGDGIKLTKEYDLATLDRSSCAQSIEHELVVCEVCGAAVGTKKHLQWLARRLGAKAYANATLILSGDGWRQLAPAPAPRTDEPPLARNDLMRVQCAACRRTTVIRELWGE